MPSIENKDLNSTRRSDRQQDDSRDNERSSRTSSSRTRIGSLLGMTGDQSRSALFNRELSEILKDNKDMMVFGHVTDLKSVSVNYIGVRKEDNSVLAVAVIFENGTSTYRRDNNENAVFTYDMLDADFNEVCQERIADDERIDEKDVIILDAQIVNSEFKVTEESVRHLAYSLTTMVWNLSGEAEETFNFDDYPVFSAKYRSHPGQLSETSELHRADFSVEANQHTGTGKKKFSKSLIKEGVESDAGKTAISGFIDVEYVGPEEDPDTYKGDVKKFKPQQFTSKLSVNSIDTSSSEEHIYERGMLGLGALYPVHNRNSWLDTLTQDLASDNSRKLSDTINNMWLPVDIKPGKIDDANAIRTNLEMALYRETYITVLHRNGDTSNGLIHCLAKIGADDKDYLAALMAAGENLLPADEDGRNGFEDELAKYLGVNEIECEDIVLGMNPIVFGTYNAGGQTRTLEDMDLFRIATVTSGNKAPYGEFLAARSLENREMNIQDSQEFQLAFAEEVLPSAEVTANGGEFQINPMFVEFIFNLIEGEFDDAEFAGYTDCRIEEDRKRRVRGETRGTLRSRASGRTFNDRRSGNFGKLRR